MGVRGIFREQQYEAFIPLHWEIWEMASINLKISGSELYASWSCSNKSSVYILVLYCEMESCVSLTLLFCHVAVANVSITITEIKERGNQVPPNHWNQSLCCVQGCWFQWFLSSAPWWLAAGSFHTLVCKRPDWKQKFLLTGPYDGHCCADPGCKWCH